MSKQSKYAENIKLQKMLRAQGLYKGKIDGIVGPATRKALQTYKAQTQPVPRERPQQPQDFGSLEPSGVTGVGGPGAEATLPLDPVAAPPQEMPPMPDSRAEIANPSYGGPNPATADWIRSAVNAAAGPGTLPAPAQPPGYQPNFAGEADYPPDFDRTFAASPEPADSGDLQRAIKATLGQILSAAVGRPGR